jgi:ribokinase
VTVSRALFVGDVSWDTTVLADRLPEPDEKVVIDKLVENIGGVVANSAIACALAGASVGLIAPVASDSAGAAARAAASQYGVDAQLEATGGATTRAIILLDGDGEKRLFLVPGAQMYPSSDVIESLVLENVGWMHTALYDHPIAARLIQRCREVGIPWSIDLEPATIPSDIGQLAEHLRGCQTVIANARATERLGPNAVDTLFHLGAQEVVETLGPEGVRFHLPGRPPMMVRPLPRTAPVCDTTGAGDALAGWFVAERMRGSTHEIVLAHAVAAASLSVGSLGASTSYPRYADLYPH